MTKRNAIETKELILTKAIQEFSKHGFDGLRMDELALKVGVNKATIYYHFKDKRFLYEQILLEIGNQTLKNLTKSLENKSNPKEKIEACLDTFIHGIINETNYARIMLQELSFNGKNISENNKKEFFKVLDLFISIVTEGIKKDIFKNIDPYLIHSITVGGLTYHMMVMELSQKEENDIYNVNFDNNFGKNIKQMVLNYILK